MGSIDTSEDVIPTIDLSPWLNSDESKTADKLAVIKELHDACVTYGFFQLVGHGIPIEMQRSVFDCAARFFALPLEEKTDVSIKNCFGRSNRGYEVLQGQTLQTGALPDLKEVCSTYVCILLANKHRASSSVLKCQRTTLEPATS